MITNIKEEGGYLMRVIPWKFLFAFVCQVIGRTIRFETFLLISIDMQVRREKILIIR